VAALAAAVLLLFLGGGGGGLGWAWQRAEQAREVNKDLKQVADLLPVWKVAEARAVMERAEGRVAGGGPADLLRRVRQMRDDLDLVDALDRIRLQAATIVEGQFDWPSVDRDYARLFRERGLAVEGEDPEGVAARIRGSVIKVQLVAALDGWHVAAAKPGRRAWLLEVARRVEPGAWSDHFRDAAARGDRAALEQLAKKASVAELSPRRLYALGAALRRAGADAVPLLTAAQERYPADFWLNSELGYALWTMGRPEEAVGYYRVALALRPGTSAVHNNLGLALKAQGRLGDALQEYRRAIDLDPTWAPAHNNLGLALRAQGRLDDAIQEYHKAIDLDPKLAPAHTNLGSALHDKGRLDDAIREYWKAIELDPKEAKAHYNLGLALKDKCRLDDAIQGYRQAIDLDPKDALAHYNLGIALQAQGRLDDAIQEYRTATKINPNLADAHSNLGLALGVQGRLDDALQECRTALDLDPKLAPAHNNLGGVLQAQGRLADAFKEYRKAIAMPGKGPVAGGGLPPASVPGTTRAGKCLPAPYRISEKRGQNPWPFPCGGRKSWPPTCSAR
jgi:tetratricopeptide (TPR) repeat protein